MRLLGCFHMLAPETQNRECPVCHSLPLRLSDAHIGSGLFSPSPAFCFSYLCCSREYASLNTDTLPAHFGLKRAVAARRKPTFNARSTTFLRRT